MIEEILDESEVYDVPNKQINDLRIKIVSSPKR